MNRSRILVVICFVIGLSALAEATCTSLDTTLGLHVIGVYQGTSAKNENTSDATVTTQYNLGEVRVNVTGTGPMVLGLSAYSAVNWIITKVPEVTITKVLVNGYDAQVVSGVPSEIVTYYTFREQSPLRPTFGRYPSEEGEDANAVIARFEQLSCAKLSSFQGAPTGKYFEILGEKTALPKVVCNVGEWNGTYKSCTGSIKAWGSMNNSDSSSDAADFCKNSGVSGSCCMYHLYGDGSWFLTNGVRRTSAKRCSDLTSDDCMASGSCKKSLGFCRVGAWNNPATSCSGTVIASGSMEDSDDPADAGRKCVASGKIGTCCMFHLYGVGKWYLTNGVKQNTGRVCETEPGGNENSCFAGGNCQ